MPLPPPLPLLQPPPVASVAPLVDPSVAASSPLQFAAEATTGLTALLRESLAAQVRELAKATAAAFVSEGPEGGSSSDASGSSGAWFSTGDLGYIVPASAGPRMAGCVVLVGRAKDTIVLLSGENVEPEPIEAALAVSPLIRHALVVGQDRRELGALVFPSEEAEARAAEAAGASSTGGCGKKEMLEREIAADVARLNAARAAYRAEDHVARVSVIWGESLSPEDGTLTRTFKVRRPAVLERHKGPYVALIAGLRGAVA